MACAAFAYEAAQARPQTVADVLAGARPAGSGRLNFWGFDVYDAKLWVSPQWRRSELTDHAFALELAYLRSFSAADIARRSIEEMRRSGDFSAAHAERWRLAMEAAFVDVKKGDRLMGVYRPGRGAQFFFNGQKTGEVADPQFARLFFLIWLGPQSSQPTLRDALLEGTSP